MRTLLVIAKAPLPGLAKSRLVDAQSLDATTVARLADAFLRDTLALCARVAYDELVIAYGPRDAAPYFRALAPRARLTAQCDGELGDRLVGAFEHAFARGATQVVVIGMDTPHLEPKIVDEAFAALAESDCVLGPATDGGYYLIGLHAPRPALFQGVPWSTQGVLAATLARAAAEGLSTRLLEEVFDIDEPDDLRRLAADLARDPGRCPATALVLSELSPGL